MTAVASLVIPAKLIRHAQEHNGDFRISYLKYEGEPDEDPTLWRVEYSFYPSEEGWPPVHGEHEALHTAFGQVMAELQLS